MLQLLLTRHVHSSNIDRQHALKAAGTQCPQQPHKKHARPDYCWQATLPGMLLVGMGSPGLCLASPILSGKTLGWQAKHMPVLLRLDAHLLASTAVCMLSAALLDE